MMKFKVFLVLAFLTALTFSCKNSESGVSDVSLSPEKKLKLHFDQDTIRIAYLGGSITNGAGASAYNKSWASLLEHKIKTESSKVVETINLGIGASDSELGLYRFAHVLKFNPDILITEFAVNDDNMDSSLTIYNHEQLYLLAKENGISMLSLNLNKEKNQSNYAYIKQVVDHHSLANVRVKMEDSDLVDGVHPGDAGHQKICNQVYDYLVNLKPEASYKKPELMSSSQVKQVTAGLDLLENSKWIRTPNSFYYLKSTVVNENVLDTTSITFTGSRLALATILRQKEEPQNGILNVQVDSLDWKSISCLNGAPYIIVKTHTLVSGLENREHTLKIVTVPDTLESGSLTKNWEILSVLTAE